MGPTANGGDLLWAEDMPDEWFTGACGYLVPVVGQSPVYELGPTGDVAVAAMCAPMLLPDMQGTGAWLRYNGAGAVVGMDQFAAPPQGDMDTDVFLGPVYLGPHNDLVLSFTFSCEGTDAPPPDMCPEGALEMFGAADQPSVDWPSYGYLSSESDALGDVFFSLGGTLERAGTLGTSWSAPTVAGAFVPDQTGGVYLTGLLGGTIDFGCGPVSPTSPDSGYLARIDASSACVFSHALPADIPAIVDESGGVILAVTITGGAMDLGCGPLGAPSGESTLVTRLDASGSCVFGRSFAAPTSLTAMPAPNGLTVVYGFVGPTAVDLGNGPLAPLGSEDMLLAELDASGDTLWSRRLGGPGITFAQGWLSEPGPPAHVSTSAAGDVYLLTGYAGAVDLGGGPITAAQGDVVVASYTSAGAYRWGRGYAFGSPSFVGIDGCGGLVVVDGDIGCTIPGPGSPAVARFAP